MIKRFLFLSVIASVLFSCQKEIRNEPASGELLGSATPNEDCGPLRTQTPGGWGSTPRGNNPGRYLHTNFSNAFPNGLTIGCLDASLTVTSPQVITDLLPTGGKAARLAGISTNPSSIKNVLVGHLIALSLSTGFDFHDEAFGSSQTLLSDMIISSGPFSGMTVGAFLQIANDVIGGCNDAYSVQNVLETATAINENYVDGETTGSFLNCPNGGGGPR